METVAKEILKGGEFLIKETDPQSVFTPEDLNEEQKMFAEMAEQFANNEVLPKMEEIEKKNFDLVIELMDKAAELGLLGANLPEQYGGMNVDFNTGTVLSEVMGKTGSFSVSAGAHSGIGTLPILYFGNEAQKEKYLPKLGSGELKAAYALTEPGSGSDALAAKTKAVLSEDGTYYTLTGQKMWITNGGFADVFVVFAQVEGDNTPDGKTGFTGFIVEAGYENFNRGAEEEKMGIKGSSTRQIFFEGVKVPAENVLGEIGQGHKIAFNVLNIGRYKLCAGSLGGIKKICDISVQYANERHQFKQPISNFGAIKHKLAEQAIRAFATESATYRTSDLIKQKIDMLKADGVDEIAAKLQAAEEYAIECAMLKVFGSEVMAYVVDEGVQIHGGMGYSEEMAVCRAYRDARINRIFEGTNEINRMLTLDMLLKRAMKGSIDLMTPGMAIQKELMSVPEFGNGVDDGIFKAEKKAIKNLKKAALMVIGSAVKKYMQDLEQEQELLMNCADMLIDLYACESALLRTEKLVASKGEEAAQAYMDMTKVYISDAAERINLSGKHALASFADGDELKMMLMGLKRFTKYDIINTKELRRKVADKLIEANEYCF